MPQKKYLSLNRLEEYDALLKAKIENDDSSTLVSAKNYVDGKITNITNGSIIVAEATHAISADNATKATQDGNGAVITATYETKADANAKLTEAKTYTDSEVAKLLNNSSEAIDSIFELRDAMAENEEVVTALESAIGNKSDKTHKHNATDITSGTLSSDRLPTVPISKGGTGATTAAGVLTNLGITATSAELNKLDGVTATTTELNYLDGVTSKIQTQLDGKVSTNRTVNGKHLSTNVTLTATDVGADVSGAAANALEEAKEYADNAIFENQPVAITSTEIDEICGMTLDQSQFAALDGNGVEY